MRLAEGVLVLVAGLAIGCGGANQGSGISYEAGVSASLSLNANLSAAQVSTFPSDVRSGWAVAYDPAVPAGCDAGGLVAGPGHAPIGERPCKAYLLERRKTTWFLRSVGHPGSLEVPGGVPDDLGHPERLKYLGSP